MSIRGKSAAIALALAATASPAIAQQAGQKITFAPGAAATTLKGKITGNASRTYLLSAVSGQTLQTLFSASNRSCHFNVFEPGSGTAAHIGSAAGNEFGRNPTLAGDYRIQVYLMRSAARRGESCRFSLSIELTGAPGGSSAGISDAQMQDRCKSEAATMYGVQPRQIAVRRVRKTPTGHAIDGTADKRAEGIKKLRCLFNSDRTFSHIMAMTSDGE